MKYIIMSDSMILSGQYSVHCFSLCTKKKLLVQSNRSKTDTFGTSLNFPF